MNTERLNIDDIKKTTSTLFFIVGTSRSGSTLLQSMLNMHSQITIPPETHFFHSYKYLCKHFKKRHNLFELDAIIQYWNTHKTRMGDLKIEPDIARQYVKEFDLHHPIDLFNLYLTIYRKKREKQIVGEKTPKHIRYVDDILNFYPDTKIISLFRDPRATANSEINASFGSPSVIVTTRRWREYIKIHYALDQNLPSSQYLMIQYRDLINNPAATLQKVVAHLGCTFEPVMLRYYNRAPEEIGFSKTEDDWKSETLEPLKKDKNEKWKFQLNDWQVSLVEYIAQPYLTKMGYVPQANTIPWLQHYFFSGVDLMRSVKAFVTRSRDEGYREPNLFGA